METLEPWLREKLERCSTLPTLPAVAMRIVQLCQREDLVLAELVKTLSTDASLSAKVLKLVNSAAYGRQREIRTLSHAVVLLGALSVQALALSFSLVPDAKSRRQHAHEAFWKRSVLSAVCAREIAVMVGSPFKEEAFLCGLLQDIGVLAFAQALGSNYQALVEVAEDDNEVLASLEHVAYGIDHAQAGEWLLRRWNLARAICRSAGLSHSPHQLERDASQDQAQLVQLTAASGLLADVWIRADVSGATERAKLCLKTLFDASEEDIEVLLSRIAEAMPSVAALFEMDLGGAEAVLSVLDQAKETLLLLNLRASQSIDSAQHTIDILEVERRKLVEEAAQDPLTGLPNRRHLERYLEEQFSMAFMTSKPLSVVMADIDFFKAINDKYGHPAGDEVLRSVGAVLGIKMRPLDLVGRYGGEEFMFVLPETHEAGAAVVAERFRAQIDATQIPVGGRSLHVTMSLGIATMGPDRYASWGELLRAADEALYAAKRAGRNRVQQWSRDA